jgi:hypothetical protein
VKISKEKLGQLLRGSPIGGTVVAAEKGYKVCCPFHHDTNPSAIVFYETGVFFCLGGCGKRSFKQLVEKLGVRYDVVEGETDLPPPAASLEALTERFEAKTADEGKLGVVYEEPWPWAEAGYRAIKSANLTQGAIYERFKPSLVRLWMKKDGRVRQERYPRLALHHAGHAVYARLSEEQQVKYYNSAGMEPSDPKVPPFGMPPHFKLPKNLAGIIVTEGPYDVLRTIQNLDEIGVGDQFLVAGLLGVSHWQSFFQKLQKHYIWQTSAPFLLALDNDEAGVKVTRQLLEQAATLMAPGRVVALPFEGHDLGDCEVGALRAGLLAVGY